MRTPEQDAKQLQKDLVIHLEDGDDSASYKLRALAPLLRDLHGLHLFELAKKESLASLAGYAQDFDYSLLDYLMAGVQACALTVAAACAAYFGVVVLVNRLGKSTDAEMQRGFKASISLYITVAVLSWIGLVASILTSREATCATRVSTIAKELKMADVVDLPRPRPPPGEGQA